MPGRAYVTHEPEPCAIDVHCVAASRCVHTLAAGALAAEQSTALVHVAATWETSVMKMSPFIFLFAYSALRLRSSSTPWFKFQVPPRLPTAAKLPRKP